MSDGGLTRGVAWGDIDRDDDPDLVVANTADGPELLYRNEGDGTFRRTDRGPWIGLGGEGRARGTGDADGDDLAEIYVGNFLGQDNVLYRNRGGLEFRRVTEGDAVRDGGRTYGISWVDYDGDGDLDLYVANWGGGDEDNDLYQNRTTERTDRSWLILELQADRDRTAVGARVRLWARVHGPGTPVLRQVRWHLPATGYASQNEPVVHFGLGLAERVDSLEIRWPSGTVDAFTDLPVRRFVSLAEGDDEVPGGAGEVGEP